MNSPVNASEPEALVSKAATRLAGAILCRVLTDAATEVQIVRDIASAAGTAASDDRLKQRIGRVIAAHLAAGLIQRAGDGLVATAAGQKAAGAFLGSKKTPTATWPQVRDGLLILRALGLSDHSAARLKGIEKLEGLRAAIVEAHWKLKIKGKPSASRLRSALALAALGRAFGNQITTELGAKSAMSSKASRLLAAQLSKKPKDYGTDARLVAALAAEAAGARRSELGQLRHGVLRCFLSPATEEMATAAIPAPTPAPRIEHPALPKIEPQPVPARAAHAVAIAAPALQAAGPAAAQATPLPAASAPVARPIATGRPDLTGFARAVKAAARERAEGWAGNRRAFISQVWALVRDRHEGWQVSEIEFKAMLAEAHRVGAIALVYADLKDKRRLADVEASAVSYKNTVWHYVRVEDEPGSQAA